MDQDKIKEYWLQYKEYFKLPDSIHQEKYKWKVLEQVYKKWNWNTDNKLEMFRNAFDVVGSKNLWLSGNFYPISHTIWMMENFKEETERQFNFLFDESKPLLERISDFVNFYDEKLPELQKLVPDKRINYHSHTDLRAIALYLTLQYPEKYFLYKFTMVKNFCDQLSVDGIKAGDKNNLEKYISIADNILQFISEDKDFIEIYRKFTNKDENFNDESLHLLTQDFIFSISQHFNEKTKFWRIGSNDGVNSFYERMLAENYIAIGWNEIGDLEEQQVQDRKSIQKLLSDSGFVFNANNVQSRKAGEIFDFYNTASVNDIVALMDGNSVLAIGKIISDYNYDSTKPFSHYRQVTWLNREVSNFTISDGTQTTFFQLKNKETITKIAKQIKNEIVVNPSKQMTANSPLNQILFGPPGTGKTYNTINKAIQIINPDFNLDQDRETIKKEYDRLIEEGQIVFTTFHQSMSYEDFVEGIKPVIEEDDEGNKSVIYEVKDGILKLIAKEASIKKFRDKEIQTEYNFDDAWNDLLENVRSEFEKNYTLKLNIQTEGMGMNILAISDRGNLVVKPSSSEENRNYTVSYDRTKKLQNAFSDLSKVRNIDKEFRSVIGGSNSTAYWSVVNFINQKIDENSKLSTLKEELAPESFVLIIDEINRGNVSQIFGELITLIEKDKRLGNDEALEAILPYSKEKFGVPNNLYIIGTMNTADRSVEALDTALRRRFSFEEMPPRYDLKKLEQTVFDFSLSEILRTINRRIEKLLDKDHCIGHAYFLGKNEDTLSDAFYRNIIPLLQEYFFGDFGKIGLVLGEGFIRKTENDSDFADFDHSDYADFAEKDSFEIVDYRNPDTYHSVRKNGIEIPMDFRKAIQLLMKQNIA